MWKLIVIYMNRYGIVESDEKTTRDYLMQCEFNQFVLFAFLYDDKQRLVETYIGQRK